MPHLAARLDQEHAFKMANDLFGEDLFSVFDGQDSQETSAKDEVAKAGLSTSTARKRTLEDKKRDDDGEEVVASSSVQTKKQKSDDHDLA